MNPFEPTCGPCIKDGTTVCAIHGEPLERLAVSEIGLLPDTPTDVIRWRCPVSGAAFMDAPFMGKR
jgi:hypothetical protein